jgi:hypothetical protein
LLEASQAADIATRRCGRPVDRARARETRAGWYFPYAIGAEEEMLFGSSGVIVHKETGAVLQLGTAFPVERDLQLYDKGYQFELYDVVVLGFASLEKAVSALESLRLQTADPEYEAGRVWRIPRRLSREEIRNRLEKLPALFEAVSLYFVAEALEQPRSDGTLQVDLLEHRR